MIRILFLVTLLGCTQAPTKGYERQSVFRPGSKNIMSITTTRSGTIEPIEIKPETIVIDTRPPFVFSLSHLPGAINLSWQEFTETNLKKQGMLVKDLFAKTRRLARAGIAPESEVVVVGDGKSGKGEEARLAWTLRYLGVKNVEFVGKDYFDQARWVGSHVQEAPKVSVPMWKPDLNKKLIVGKDEIKKFMIKRKDLKPKDNTNVVEGEIGEEKLKPGRMKIIDSRPSKDYLAGSGVHFSPDVDVVNIEWTEFIDEHGRPDPSIISKLKNIGIGFDSKIIVLSQNGLESATVVMTLVKLGMNDVGHVAGGIDELLGRF